MTASRCAAIAALLLTACKPCSDDCDEYVELSFLSAAPDGMFASTSYDVVANADGEAVSCSFDVMAGTADCMGDADAHVDAGDGMGEAGTGGFDDGRRRLVMRWHFAPDTLDVTVRDATQTLVLDNTLTPAYQDQDVKACDSQCRFFDQDLMLPAM